jgi:hypothetical protein
MSMPPATPPQADAVADYSCHWKLGGKRCCGTLKNPGIATMKRADETDHCFPSDASHHFVCCVDIQVRVRGGGAGRSCCEPARLAAGRAA